MNCPGCNGNEFTELGSLGSLKWYRCRRCGLDVSKKTRPRRKPASGVKTTKKWDNVPEVD